MKWSYDGKALAAVSSCERGSGKLARSVGIQPALGSHSSEAYFRV